MTPQSCISNVFQTNIVWTILPSFATRLKCTLMSLNKFWGAVPQQALSLEEQEAVSF